MGILSAYSRFAAGVIGMLTLAWGASWVAKGYYLGGGLIILGAYAALPWERSRHLVTFGKLGVGGFVQERIATALWMLLVFLGVTALISSGGITP